VWTGHERGPDDEIFVSYWTGSSWTPEQMVSQDDDALDSQPSLVLDQNGGAWVAWKGRVRDGQNSHLRILVSYWDPTHMEWSPEAVASSPLDWDVDERQPQLFIDQQGATRLVWVATRGSESAVAHARLDEGNWRSPQLLYSGKVGATSLAITTTGSGAPLVAWLNPTSDSQQPLEWHAIKDGVDGLEAWLEAIADRAPASGLVDPVPNRTLAFGDSITRGGYADMSYPVRLEGKLDLRVAESEVVNRGNPGERTYGGSERLYKEIKAYKPMYVLVMEGTNDVTDRSEPADVYDNLLTMIDRARNESDVDGFQIMLATLVPRLDDQNDATQAMNDLAIRPAAADRDVPVCDQWQAFYGFGPWDLLFRDDGKHPNDDGLQLIADTFYDCMLAFFPDVEEETTPPTTWIDSLPAQSECGQIPVTWDGSDNLNWVVDYDVQARTAGGFWTNWLEGTVLEGAAYPGGRYNDTVDFRVRGRDLVGNLGNYSAPASTLVTIDNDPPYDAGVWPLPPVQAAPFPVSWWGVDACADVISYAVEYKEGISGTWQEWLPETTGTGADFGPASPIYGETYYFRVRPRDEALNWGSWSDPDATSTILARHAIEGQAYNVRHQPVTLPDVEVSPPPMFTEIYPGGAFSAYVDASGDYDVEVNKLALYGALPPMQNLPVNDDLGDQQFVLPPHDDAVTNGGFDAGTLDDWQRTGSNSPQWTVVAHTGTGAAQVGGGSGDSHLSQTINPDIPLSDPTLSFLVRLAVAGASGPLGVVLSDSDPGTPDLEDTLTIDTDGWSHIWYDLSTLTTPPYALTFSVANTPAVYIDEVRLGSAVQGQFWTYLPIVRR
jgi:lysophospholipase L1-like esterase